MARMRTSTLALGLGVALAGCVPSHAQLLRPVDTALAAHGLTVDESQTDAAIAAKLAVPLTLADAVAIAVARNRDLRVVMADVGVAGADLAVASGLRPLEVDATWKFATDGHGSELELNALQDVLDLVRVGGRRGVARARLGAAQARAVGAALRLATDVEIAVAELAAAQAQHAAQHVAADAASASAELAQRLFDAGNTSALTLAQEQAQRETVAVTLGQTAAVVEAARLRLGALLGVADASGLQIATPLAEVPPDAPALATLADDAVAASQGRLALVADAAAARGDRREARLRAWLPELSVGASVGRHDGAWAAGPALRIGVPICGQGQGTRARADAEVARASLATDALDGRLVAHAHAVQAQATSAHAEARRLIDKVLPLHRTVLAETLRQYNAMNASTFELLSARAALVTAEQAAVDAARRYWVAMAEVTGLRRGASFVADDVAVQP